MDRIEIGMQEAHRDRGRAGFPDAGDGLVERGLIERNQTPRHWLSAARERQSAVRAAPAAPAAASADRSGRA